MTTPADIFETLAQLPDRTPAQRAADERSAAILRSRGEQFPHLDEGDQLYTEDQLRDAIVEQLAQVLDDLPPSSKAAQRVVKDWISYVEAS